MGIFGTGFAGAKTVDVTIFNQFNHIPGLTSQWQYGYWKDGDLPYEDHSNFLVENAGVGSMARVTNGFGLDSGDVYNDYGWAYAHVKDSVFGTEEFYSWYYYF
ncbi:hypothetical protein OfM1_09230 [Lactovum odontotermitis]